MLKNYQQLENGIVKQVRLKRYLSAEIDYKTYYDQLGEKTEQMSTLRLGYLLGIVGTPKSILDIGYGNGSFLAHASAVVPKCFGHDIQDFPLPQDVKFVNNIHNSYYDVITFFDSLEHFNDIDFVGSLRCSFVCISVPECHRPTDIDWFKSWKHRKPDEHLWHFSRKALIQFMAGHGFTPIAMGNVEDIIRGNLYGESNILTAVFKKITVQI